LITAKARDTKGEKDLPKKIFPKGNLGQDGSLLLGGKKKRQPRSSKVKTGGYSRKKNTTRKRELKYNTIKRNPKSVGTLHPLPRYKKKCPSEARRKKLVTWALGTDAFKY